MINYTCDRCKDTIPKENLNNQVLEIGFKPGFSPDPVILKVMIRPKAGDLCQDCLKKLILEVINDKIGD